MEVFYLKITINSPMQPTLFKQTVKVNDAITGYLSANKFYQLVFGKHSFKSKFGTSIVSLNEQGKQNGKRSWTMNLQKRGTTKEKTGSMVMTSKMKDTFRNNATFYEAVFNDDKYYVKKPYMQLGKEEAFLYNSEDVLLANIISSYKQKPRLKKVIVLNNDIKFKEEEIAFFIVTLNTTMFVS